MMQNEIVSTYWDTLWKQSVKQVSNRLKLSISGQCKVIMTSVIQRFLFDEMRNAKNWLSCINDKLIPKDIKVLSFTLSLNDKQLKEEADFRILIITDNNKDVYVFSNSFDIYDKYSNCLILKTNGSKIERYISNEQILKNFEYQIQKALKFNGVQFQRTLFRNKKLNLNIVNKKWLVTSRDSEGYTEDNCGQPSNNQQVICIIEAQNIEEAYRKLKRERPHLFAMNLQFSSMRWTAFNFYELNYKSQPAQILVQKQDR